MPALTQQLENCLSCMNVDYITDYSRVHGQNLHGQNLALSHHGVMRDRAPFYQRERYELVLIAHLHMRIVKFNEWFRVLVSSLYMLKRETYEENQRASIFS